MPLKDLPQKLLQGVRGQRLKAKALNTLLGRKLLVMNVYQASPQCKYVLLSLFITQPRASLSSAILRKQVAGTVG